MRVYCVVGSGVFPVFPVSYVFLAEFVSYMVALRGVAEVSGGLAWYPIV